MLIETATLVRQQIEEHVKVYSTDINPNDLCGACGIASWLLTKVCRKLGYNAKFVMGVFINNHDAFGFTTPANTHCWVVVNDLIIIDVTATQFGITDKVFVTTVDDKRYVCHHVDKSALHRLSTWEYQSHSYHRFALDKMLKSIHRQSMGLYAHQLLSRYDAQNDTFKRVAG